jgi:phosphatidylglycerophosphatase A
MKFAAKAFATFFGAGYMPLAPGTFASLISALLYKYVLVKLGGPFYAVLIAIIFFAGAFSAKAFSQELDEHDPRKIVIDEVCGQLIALYLIPPLWLYVGLGFLFFRFFDIVKPFGIRKLERLTGGWGIMADDVLAGIYSVAILHLYLLFLK